MGPFGDFGNLRFVATWGLARFCGPCPVNGVRAEEVPRVGTWTHSATPPRGRDFNLNLVHYVLDRSLSAMSNAQQRRKIYASATMKPGRVVRSRGRSGMGSNIAWHRRHNDSVD